MIYSINIWPQFVWEKKLTTGPNNIDVNEQEKIQFYKYFIVTVGSWFRFICKRSIVNVIQPDCVSS
jgi:hypothetical protein